MAMLEDVADGLAKRVVEPLDKTGDETRERRIADEVCSSSPTLQEAYLTAMRIRKAERRGHALLDRYAAGQAIPKAGISAQPQDDGGH